MSLYPGNHYCSLILIKSLIAGNKLVRALVFLWSLWPIPDRWGNPGLVSAGTYTFPFNFLVISKRVSILLNSYLFLWLCSNVTRKKNLTIFLWISHHAIWSHLSPVPWHLTSSLAVTSKNKTKFKRKQNKQIGKKRGGDLFMEMVAWSIESQLSSLIFICKCSLPQIIGLV